MARWLLPEGISDVLPHEAARLEELRRALLDLYRGYGYQLVFPPLVEYVESLLTGAGPDLDLRTFKLVDQMSGRLMGLRADTTPQVARIDAHILNRSGIARLCYAGSVLHARPRHALAVREPFQVGAELYGHAGPEADAEVLALAVASLRRAGMARVHVDLGHTGVLRALLDADRDAAAATDGIVAALSAKDEPALRAATQACGPAVRDGLLALLRAHGGVDTIDAARVRLAGFAGAGAALDTLAWLAQRCDADSISIDLSDLHGYRYHTGVTFAAYGDGSRAALLRGGRYDDIGSAFGRARPATGFSIDLRELTRSAAGAGMTAILAPATDEGVAGKALDATVAQLRDAGEVVVRMLDGGAPPEGYAFDRELVWRDGRWQIVPRRPSEEDV